MPKRPLPYQCGHCGVRFPKWMGRCPDCGEWESVREDLALYGGKVVPLTRERTAPAEDGEGDGAGQGEDS